MPLRLVFLLDGTPLFVYSCTLVCDHVFDVAKTDKGSTVPVTQKEGRKRGWKKIANMAALSVGKFLAKVWSWHGSMVANIQPCYHATMQPCNHAAM